MTTSWVSALYTINYCIRCRDAGNRQPSRSIIFHGCADGRQLVSVRRVVAIVRRNFKRLDVSDFSLIYKTYIRPRLEYCCIQPWCPYLVKDIEVLERVQKAAIDLELPQLRKCRQIEGFGSYITERSQRKRRHDRGVQDTEWEGTHRRRTVLQVSWEALLSAGTWYEVNQER